MSEEKPDWLRRHERAIEREIELRRKESEGLKESRKRHNELEFLKALHKARRRPRR